MIQRSKVLVFWSFFSPLFGYMGFFFKHNAVKPVWVSALLMIGLKLIFMYPNASTNQIDCPGDCSSKCNTFCIKYIFYIVFKWIQMKFYFLKIIISFLFISMCINTNHMFINKVNILLALCVPWHVCITFIISLFQAYLGFSFPFFFLIFF